MVARAMSPAKGLIDEEWLDRLIAAVERDEQVLTDQLAEEPPATPGA
jgi:hypothetical protein